MIEKIKDWLNDFYSKDQDDSDNTQPRAQSEKERTKELLEETSIKYFNSKN